MRRLRFFDRLAAGTVLVVSHGFQRNYERGFCNGLAAAGVPFVLLSSDRSDHDGLAAGAAALNLRGSQDEARPSWRKALNLLRYHLALLAYVAWQRPAVVHVIGLIEPTWLCGQLHARWYRWFAGRYLLTVHDTERHDHGGDAERARYAAAFRRADGLVVHTQRLRPQLAAMAGVPIDRITVMEHGIEPLQPPPVLPPRPPGAPLQLLCFGFVLRYKGHDLLLDALAGIGIEFRLTIAGRCADAALAAELQQRIATHPHAARIAWHNGYVEEAAMEAMFRDADALVLPYRRIDQSGVLLQAFRWGLPVVASRVGAFEDYVDAERGELCAPDDVAALRAALQRLAARRQAIDRQRLLQAGRQYEWPVVVRSLLPLYGLQV